MIMQRVLFMNEGHAPFIDSQYPTPTNRKTNLFWIVPAHVVSTWTRFIYTQEFSNRFVQFADSSLLPIKLIPYCSFPSRGWK
jgi:hypothetical protein